MWRSGLGITKDGRIVFVYGPALNVQDLADLLQRAGAVEGMQLDINPYWMKYDYYSANSHPCDPTPVNLLPNQQTEPLLVLHPVYPGLHSGIRAGDRRQDPGPWRKHGTTGSGACGGAARFAWPRG